MRRCEEFSHRFHLDVADGHYTPTMLFFPDLVAQLRPLTSLPLEVHLMTAQPLAWIDPFVEAGADVFVLCYDSLDVPASAIDAVKRRGKLAGVSLRIDEPVELLDPYWTAVDQVTIIGTAMGVKGASLDESIPEKIRAARRRIEAAGAKTEIQADGGIRRHTVPLLAEAGVDWIVPGSLAFGDRPPNMRQWLNSFCGAKRATEDEA
jgi:ribulose-phosphate 3-epimerase